MNLWFTKSGVSRLLNNTAGYNRPAFVHLITTKDTVDDLIFSSNTDKAMTQEELMEALKAQIEGGQK